MPPNKKVNDILIKEIDHDVQYFKCSIHPYCNLKMYVLKNFSKVNKSRVLNFQDIHTLRRSVYLVPFKICVKFVLERWDW